MKDALRRILDEKGGDVHTASPDELVVDAVATMNEHRIGAVLVLSDGRPVGIFTERDVLTRVLSAGKSSTSTKIGEVMTEDVICVAPETTVEEAMAVVTEKRCRHLPVVEGREVIGMVSIGDLTRWVTRGQRFEIRQLVNYVTRRYPA